MSIKQKDKPKLNQIREILYFIKMEFKIIERDINQFLFVLLQMIFLTYLQVFTNKQLEIVTKF
jgi:hypothetical protein